MTPRHKKKVIFSLDLARLASIMNLPQLNSTQLNNPTSNAC
jgi:hypothetical protein